MHTILTSVVYEGDCFIAFGLVSYNAAKDTFTMNKSSPLALVSGGIQSLFNYLQSRVSKCYRRIAYWGAITLGIGALSLLCFAVMNHNLKVIRARKQTTVQGRVQINEK